MQPWEGTRQCAGRQIEQVGLVKTASQRSLREAAQQHLRAAVAKRRILVIQRAQHGAFRKAGARPAAGIGHLQHAQSRLGIIPAVEDNTGLLKDRGHCGETLSYRVAGHSTR